MILITYGYHAIKKRNIKMMATESFPAVSNTHILNNDLNALDHGNRGSRVAVTLNAGCVVMCSNLLRCEMVSPIDMDSHVDQNKMDSWSFPGKLSGNRDFDNDIY